MSVPSSVDDIIAELARSMPLEQARVAVKAEARRLGVKARGLSVDDVLRLLDALAAGDGLAAVCARFAKARVLLAAGMAPGPTKAERQ